VYLMRRSTRNTSAAAATWHATAVLWAWTAVAMTGPAVKRPSKALVTSYDLAERGRVSLVAVDAARCDGGAGGDGPDDRADGHGGDEVDGTGEEDVLRAIKGRRGQVYVQGGLSDCERHDSTEQAGVACWK
jgi:hypothetical protein